MMAKKLILVLALAVPLFCAGCKKRQQFTLPLYPGASQVPSGGNQELPEATVLHFVLQTPDGLGAVRTFYTAELEKLGWTHQGDVWNDGNMGSPHDFGKSGSCEPVDPSKPGGLIQMTEIQNTTLVDLYQSVPKGK